jgi:hypothetical protein
VKLVPAIAGAALGAAILAFAPPANASCVCECVNGHVQALCQSNADLPPLCAPQLCPPPPRQIAPLPNAELPPLGTTHCEEVQVLNPQTGQYEWQKVCQ